MRTILRHHGLAALFAGLALGTMARVVMRIIAVATGLPGSFTVGGSADVVLFGALLGAPVALGFFTLRGRVPLRPPLAGLATAGLLVLALAVWPPASARSAMEGTPQPWPLTAGPFALLLFLFGMMLEWRWQRWASRSIR